MRVLNSILAAVSIAGTCCTVHAKEGPTYYTPAEIARIRERAASPEYRVEVKAIVAAASVLADRSDEELWNLVPPADLTRALTVRYESDCPVHGKEIYKAGGRFPWITDPNKPFKVECPVGHEVYPSNDFAAYLKGGRKGTLNVNEKYVDDGNGYVDEDGNRYFFVGYYNFWRLWRKTLIDGIAACGNAYLVTGDPKYAHKAAVTLASISRVYPQMDYAKQAYHNGKWPAAINGRILDYIWENQTVGAFAVAYDVIYPSLADDESLRSIAQANGVGDVKVAIEQNILQPMASDLLAKKIWGNKFELRSTASLALILDNQDPAKGVTTPQMIEWLLKGGGDLEFTFYNGFDRDGWGGESSLSYSNIWNAATIAAADDLSRLGVSMAQDPKWRRLAKAALEMRLLDGMVPRLGDVDGMIKGNQRYILEDALMFGVTHFDDADCAKLLLRRGSFKPPLLSRSAIDDAKLKLLARKSTFPDAPYTRDLGGYGLAVLEIDDGTAMQSATMYYGSPMASHGHSDRLTMSLHLADRDVLPDLGYPSQWGPAADWWVKNTVSHYGVLVDEEPQTARYAGYLTGFASLPHLKFAEAQARSVWQAPPLPAEVPLGSIGGEVRKTPPQRERVGPPVTDYRRLMSLLDTGEKSTLLVEAFIVEGGHQHDYSFHGLPYGEFAVHDAKLIREQKRGTVAGEDVEVGADIGRRGRSGFQFLQAPRFYEPGDAPRCDWLNDEDINQRTWFPRLSFDQMIVADGVPPTYPGSPASMPFILLRHQGEANLTSLFISITEAGKQVATVKSVKPIRSAIPTAGGAIVELTSGSQLKIYINTKDEPATFEDGAQSANRLVVVRYENGQARRVQRIGSGAFKSAGGQTEDTLDQDEMTIGRVDYRTNRVVVSGKAPSDVGPQGLVLLASRDDTSHASYTAREAKAVDGGTELSFGDIPLITGRFEAAWDPSTKLIVSKERTGGVYNQFVAHSFVGMSVVSEDLATTAVITAHDPAKDTFTIEADDETARRFTDLNGDGRAYVYIADLAPGVKLRTTPAAEVEVRAEMKR